jgi:hypothetical protein
MEYFVLIIPSNQMLNARNQSQSVRVISPQDLKEKEKRKKRKKTQIFCRAGLTIKGCAANF